VNPELTATLLVVAAYLFGAIPFGFLLAKWLKGVDVRTVGSGNIGATNVARVLGFWFFWPVFLFDMSKGLVPTLVFPILAARFTGRPAPPDLAVLVALATILGHNFPVYLKFRGGKGVATSLGAVFALDPIAGAGAAWGFVIFLLITRYVSLSSIGGGMVFFLVHFARVHAPWARGERAMSVLTVGLLVLLVARHRKNFARIWAGTESKVNLRKKKSPPGHISATWLLALAVFVVLLIGGVAVWNRAARHEVLAVGRYTLAEVAREGTGHQRAERVVFADGGKLLAVTCPRYNRLVLYRVTDRDALELLEDVALDGKPVAVCAAKDRLYVLERPPGDNRHVEAGWWDVLNFRGEKVGDRVLVGYYPDDMALSPDGRHAFVLSSGRAEGDAKKPAPALDVYEMGAIPKSVGRVTFDGSRDDPARITLSTTGRCAAVTLLGAGESAAVDLFEPARPRLIGRSPLAQVDHPYPSRSEDDFIVMPVASGREALLLSFHGFGDCVLTTLPQGSGLELYRARQSRPLGKLTLHAGAFGLGTTRPTGLAFSDERGLIAVANRSGGVHLVAIRTAAERVASRTETGN
jgi:glycerol-3-phosphate acyltransferase PlsY